MREEWAALVSEAGAIGLRLGIVLLALPLLFRLSTVLTRRLARRLSRGQHPTDKTLTRSALYLLRLALKSAATLGAIGFLGVDLSGIAALIASLGVGVGLALNGALANLVGGGILLLTRPFRIDDFIEVEGVSGTVEDIRLTLTRLRTPDGRTVYLPNGTLSAAVIVNLSEQRTRRLELTFPVAHDRRTEARALILACAAREGRLLSSPAPQVLLTERTAQGITLALRAWVDEAVLWDVHYALTEDIHATLAERGIHIPSPTVELHTAKDGKEGR